MGNNGGSQGLPELFERDIVRTAFINSNHFHTPERKSLGEVEYDEIIHDIKAYESRYRSVVQDFKRRTLGLCGTESVKTIDELAAILQQMSVVSSIEHGREFVPHMEGMLLPYTGFGREIILKKIPNEQRYTITKVPLNRDWAAYNPLIR